MIMPLVTPIEFFQLLRLRLAAREDVFVSDATRVQPFLFCCFLRICSTVYNQIKEAVLLPLFEPGLWKQEPLTPVDDILVHLGEKISDLEPLLESWLVLRLDEVMLLHD